MSSEHQVVAQLLEQRPFPPATKDTGSKSTLCFPMLAYSGVWIAPLVASASGTELASISIPSTRPASHLLRWFSSSWRLSGRVKRGTAKDAPWGARAGVGPATPPQCSLRTRQPRARGAGRGPCLLRGFLGHGPQGSHLHHSTTAQQGPHMSASTNASKGRLESRR